MSTKETIELLYQRYLNNDISMEELEDFLNILDTAKGEVTIAKLMDGTWEEMFEEKRAKVVPVFYRSWFRISAAAIILLFLAVGSLYLLKKPAQDNVLAEQSPGTIKNDIAPGGNRALLTLADGTTVILDSAHSGAITKQGNVTIIKLDEGKLAYQSSESGDRPSAIKYNTISTPRGGQYQLVLADGSKVWLNAASTLRFPTTFTRSSREVTLTGEGYFEVAADASKPFRVRAGNVTVEVLGTHFNINAYQDDNYIKATLLEGSVKVYNMGTNKIISPGEQAQMQDIPGTGILVQNVDVDNVVAWKNGYFSFHKASLKEVMRQLARWYDVDIEYEGEIPQREFGGKIDRNSNASQVLKILEESNVHFKIEKKKIIVMP